jgi:hypothetical protein
MAAYLALLFLGVGSCWTIFNKVNAIKINGITLGVIPAPSFWRNLVSVLCVIAGSAMVLSPFFYEFPAWLFPVVLVRPENGELKYYPAGEWALTGYSPGFFRLPSSSLRDRLTVPVDYGATVAVEFTVEDSFYVSDRIAPLCDFTAWANFDSIRKIAESRVQSGIETKFGPLLREHDGDWIKTAGRAELAAVSKTVKEELAKTGISLTGELTLVRSEIFKLPG